MDYNKEPNSSLHELNKVIVSEVEKKKKEVGKLLDEIDDLHKEHVKILEVYNKRFNK